ncbi:MAG: hypothetical protein M1834_001150 [Cirrosporium novae-zelandiae]|nr:MAG: hypothetical protein M1834_001150 [Cirrosporium novae-zelandiae]
MIRRRLNTSIDRRARNLSPNEEEPLELRPCIAELVRTEYCPPELLLLVDKILIVDTETEHEILQAYKLFLSDGEYCIQAVLKSEVHRFVWTGETKEGSYIVLTKYELARAKRLNGNGEVAYIAIADFHVVGYDGRESNDSIQTEVRQKIPPSSHPLTEENLEELDASFEKQLKMAVDAFENPSEGHPSSPTPMEHGAGAMEGIDVRDMQSSEHISLKRGADPSDAGDSKRRRVSPDILDSTSRNSSHMLKTQAMIIEKPLLNAPKPSSSIHNSEEFPNVGRSGLQKFASHSSEDRQISFTTQTQQPVNTAKNQVIKIDAKITLGERSNEESTTQDAILRQPAIDTSQDEQETPSLTKRPERISNNQSVDTTYPLKSSNNVPPNTPLKSGRYLLARPRRRHRTLVARNARPKGQKLYDGLSEFLNSTTERPRNERKNYFTTHPSTNDNTHSHIKSRSLGNIGEISAFKDRETAPTSKHAAPNNEDTNDILRLTARNLHHTRRDNSAVDSKVESSRSPLEADSHAITTSDNGTSTSPTPVSRVPGIPFSNPASKSALSAHRDGTTVLHGRSWSSSSGYSHRSGASARPVSRSSLQASYTPNDSSKTNNPSSTSRSLGTLNAKPSYIANTSNSINNNHLPKLPTRNSKSNQQDTPRPHHQHQKHNLKITSLSHLPHLPPRNYRLTALIIITSVSPTIKRPRANLNMLPQRDCEVTDLSLLQKYLGDADTTTTSSSSPQTLKTIPLSVFVDAQNFNPQPGTVALIKNVRTHEWKGGSLKAYDVDCGGGREWFVGGVERLVELGVDMEVVGALGDLWDVVARRIGLGGDGEGKG